MPSPVLHMTEDAVECRVCGQHMGDCFTQQLSKDHCLWWDLNTGPSVHHFHWLTTQPLCHIISCGMSLFDGGKTKTLKIGEETDSLLERADAKVVGQVERIGKEKIFKNIGLKHKV